MMAAINGVEDPRYIPEDIFINLIQGALNNDRLQLAYVDKNNYDRLFPDCLRPKTIIRNIAGQYFDESRRLDPESAQLRVEDYRNDFVIKPSLNTGSGLNVKMIRQREDGYFCGDQKVAVGALLKEYGADFIVQEAVTWKGSIRWRSIPFVS